MFSELTGLTVDKVDRFDRVTRLTELTGITMLNFPWRSQGEAKPPGSQRSQPLSLPVPWEVGLSISSRSAL